MKTTNLIIKIDELPVDLNLNQLFTLFQKEERYPENLLVEPIELERLQVNKYIKITDYDTWEWEFRQKALDLLKTGIVYYDSKGIGSKNPNLEDLVSKYRKLFKETGMSGRTADVRTTTKKLEWFQKEYDYSEDVILKATTKYIDQEAHNNFKYLQRCDYFISKEDTSKIKVSRLASFCEEIEDNYEAESNYGTFNKLL